MFGLAVAVRLSYRGGMTTAAPRFVVLGHPIGHSKSPLIHQQFAAQFGEAIDYQALDVDPGTFEEVVHALMAEGFRGCNVTVPYKQEAWQISDERSGRAELAGAVNTLSFHDGRILGDNTDGIGLLRDLTLNLDQPVYDKRMLVLGAGGAVRGVLAPLLEQAPRAMVLANRTVSRAEELAQVFSSIGPVMPCGFADLGAERFDLVINGTSASLGGEVPPLPDGLFNDNALAYDLMYASEPTAFMEWAAHHGAARVADGLGMLVEQAAESFDIWWGKRPETAEVIRQLRDN